MIVLLSSIVVSVVLIAVLPQSSSALQRHCSDSMSPFSSVVDLDQHLLVMFSHPRSSTSFVVTRRVEVSCHSVVCQSSFHVTPFVLLWLSCHVALSRAFSANGHVTKRGSSFHGAFQNQHPPSTFSCDTSLHAPCVLTCSPHPWECGYGLPSGRLTTHDFC